MTDPSACYAKQKTTVKDGIFGRMEQPEAVSNADVGLPPPRNDGPSQTEFKG
jgi:hypothetical protein